MTVEARAVEKLNVLSNVISARAVASVPKLVALCQGCAKSGTRWLLPRGRVDEPQLEELTNTNIAAGSDTTAIALRFLVYSLLTHPTVFEKFMVELKGVIKSRSMQPDFESKTQTVPQKQLTAHRSEAQEKLTGPS